jgi:hypothetical protein
MTFGGDFSSQCPIVLAYKDRIKGELDYLSTSLSYVTPPQSTMYNECEQRESDGEKNSGLYDPCPMICSQGLC